MQYRPKKLTWVGAGAVKAGRSAAYCSCSSAAATWRSDVMVTCDQVLEATMRRATDAQLSHTPRYTTCSM